MKSIMTAAALAAVITIPTVLSAQQKATGTGAPGVTDQPREVMPTIPGQPAPKRPDFDQRLPGQQNTIPEMIEPPSGPIPKEFVVSPAEVRKAQEALKARGYNPGAVSGNLHAGTREALRQFQKDNNLTATGVLDEETATKLRVNIHADRPAPSKQPGATK